MCLNNIKLTSVLKSRKHRSTVSPLQTFFFLHKVGYTSMDSVRESLAVGLACASDGITFRMIKVIGDINENHHFHKRKNMS